METHSEKINEGENMKNWQIVVQSVVEKAYSWEQLTRLFPELDNETVKEYYNKLVSSQKTFTIALRESMIVKLLR